jgi:hypothetical protein
LKEQNIPSPINGIVEMQESPPQGAWTSDEIEHQIIQGIPWLNEVFLFHKPSNIMFVADLAGNIKEGLVKLKNSNNIPLAIKYAKKVGISEQLGVSKGFSYFVKDRGQLKKSLEKVSQWDFKGVAMAHGVPVLSTDTSISLMFVFDCCSGRQENLVGCLSKSFVNIPMKVGYLDKELKLVIGYSLYVLCEIIAKPAGSGFD